MNLVQDNPSVSAMTRIYFALLLTVCLSATVFAQPVDPQRVTIVRDSWGVPHIYAPTDAEACYGIAWAHCEDDYQTLQKMLLVSRGRLGEVDGIEGAALDFLYQLSGIREHVRARMDQDVSPEFRRLCEAYVQGANDYAAKHPEGLLKTDLYPITVEDMIRGYSFTTMIFTGFPFAVQAIFENRAEEWKEGFFIQGSNAIAANRNKTADGKTFLAVNSHQPLEGLFSWYEVHVTTDEGWEMIGGIFPGGNVIFHGTAKHHGWAATFNWPDLVDIYKLKINPKNKLQYWFDGKWETMEELNIPLKVKLGGITIKVNRKAYRTKHGPAMKNKEGVYALRTPQMFNKLKAGDQLYKMNKAKNLQEWKSAFELQGIPSLNFVYADAESNIFYTSNSVSPKRQTGYDWRRVLPGDTSATLWTDVLPFSCVPQIANPKCGYVFNTNNTPYSCTGPAEHLKPEGFDPTMGLQSGDNNRSNRLMELMEAAGKITFEDFARIKYDRSYPKNTKLMASLQPIFDLKAEEHPDIAASIRKIHQWNLGGQPDNRDAPVAFLSMMELFAKYKGGSYELEVGLKDLTKEDALWAIRKAQSHLLKVFGTVDVALGEVQRHIRGLKSIPLGGLPDVLAAIYSVEEKKGPHKGRHKAVAGESYIQLVQYGPNGVEKLETVNAYGTSAVPGSPHYDDQMEMFVNQQRKPMTFDKETILKTAHRVYHPE